MSENQNSSPGPSPLADLSLRHCLIYAMPHIAVMWLMSPLGVVQGIYAKYYGLSLVTLATVLSLGRFVDVILDPLVGYCSDRYYERHSTRKPFMAVGGLLFLVGAWALFIPPETITTAYLVIWLMVFYLGFTLWEIPHVTWGGELAPGSEAKTRIYSVRAMALQVGVALFFIIPLLPLFNSREITPETLRVTVWLAGALLLVLLPLCLSLTPNGPRSLAKQRSHQPSTPTNPAANHRKTLWLTLLKNQPMQIFLAAFLFSMMGSGMWNGLLFIYVDTYLGLGEQFAGMTLFSIATVLCAIPLLTPLASRFGKKAVWLLAMVLVLISLLYTATLEVNNTDFTQLILLNTLFALGQAGMSVIPAAVLSEIIDYHRWKHDQSQDAVFFSSFIFTSKLSGTVGFALGLAIAGWFGFDPAQTAHSAESVQGLMLAMVWIPLVLCVIATVFVAKLPINARRHRIIRRRLDSQPNTRAPVYAEPSLSSC